MKIQGASGGAFATTSPRRIGRARNLLAMSIAFVSLSFSNLTMAQASAILAAAEATGVEKGVATLSAKIPAYVPVRTGFELPAPVVDQAKEAALASPGPIGSDASPASSSPVIPKSSSPIEREPGSDDGPPLSEAEAQFFRCPTVKAVVKMLVGDQAAPDADKVLADVRALRARGVAALEAVPEEQLADRVASSLAALGF